MVFSSAVFIFYFLPVFLFVYYCTGMRNAVILVGSLAFYVWGEGVYILLLVGLLILNRWLGIAVSTSHRARLTLSIGIFLNLTVLVIFKYSQFFLDVASNLIGSSSPKLDIHLPLGISFFIFQLISYLIEVHRRSIEPERNLVRLSTYIMMFPHLVAGPIVRYSDIVQELHHRRVGVDKIGLGIQYFIVGLCQKVMIANSVAPAADHLFGLGLDSIHMSEAWIGSVAYMLQIYFDFCGYSNMAIGLAFLLGFHFPRNFDYPYSSRSITEFWRRWHMSLSFWFRDYVYIPLGGSREGSIKTVRNLLIVFAITGLWHGAAWTFILWGIYHGIFVVLEYIYLNARLTRIPSVISRAYTLIVVMVGWVFFRAESLSQTTAVLKALVGFDSDAKTWPPIAAWMTPEITIGLIAGVILSFPVIPRILKKAHAVEIKGALRLDMKGHPTEIVHALPTVVLVIGLIISVFLLVSSTLNPFLYFRF